MFALPMEPKDVTRDAVADVFPPHDILQAWMNGEDAEWPTAQDDEPAELRFDVGTAVQCRVGPEEWSNGTISKLWYRESQWPDGAFAPHHVAQWVQ
jgi:hypothetical protein